MTDVESLKSEIRGALARGYCTDENSLKELDTDLTEAMAKEVEKLFSPYIEALIWCSGSDDFQDGRQARKGWEKLCMPLIHRHVTTKAAEGRP
jgi:hypothetical protein